MSAEDGGRTRAGQWLDAEAARNPCGPSGPCGKPRTMQNQKVSVKVDRPNGRVPDIPARLQALRIVNPELRPTRAGTAGPTPS
jgi:hypothetical protein